MAGYIVRFTIHGKYEYKAFDCFESYDGRMQMEPQRTLSGCVCSTLQHVRVSADAGVLSTLNKREAPRQTRAARGAAPLRPTESAQT